MNEPLKLKLFSIYGQILHEKVLRDAWKHVKANNGCAGIDRMTIERFERDLDENINDLAKSLKEKTYKPSPVKRVYIPKKNGKMRPLGIPTIKDRIVQQALVDRLTPFFEEKIFHDNSCGFRPNRDVKMAIKKILCRLECGYLYIYDFDIKGYFDNIPHKKLMKVLNKYISDGTVLDLIWRWLKSGYMEDEIRYESKAGTMQGGVISPLLANIYLNELDWELDKANLEFVRYADDSIVMCKTPEELKRAKQVVKAVLDKLGLELAEDKSDDIDFHKKDFSFLGFRFEHLSRSKKGNVYYRVRPSDKALRKFKEDIKARTGKSLSRSFEQWTDELNPILRGKFNYFLISTKACLEMEQMMKERGRVFHGIPFKKYEALDGYVRQRLRVNFANRGKRHAGYTDGKKYTVKYGNRFFLKDMGLVSGAFLRSRLFYPDHSIDDFLAVRAKKKNPYDQGKDEFFKIALAK